MINSLHLTILLMPGKHFSESFFINTLSQKFNFDFFKVLRQVEQKLAILKQCK